MNLEGKTDEELVLFAQKNGHKDEIFSKLYLKHRKAILNYSIYLCRNKEIAEEITQDTFMKFYTYLGSYDKKHNATLKTWIYLITKNTFIDYYRREKIRSKLFIDKDDLLENKKLIKELSNPEQKIIDKEKFAKI